MSHPHLHPVTQAFERINAYQSAFATEIEKHLCELSQLCHEIDARAAWVEQRQREIQASDIDLFARLAEKIDQIAVGDRPSLDAIVTALQERIGLHDADDVQSHQLRQTREQNSRLAAELKLARARAAQLSKTVEAQQQVIEREQAVASELLLLQQTLRTHRELFGADASQIEDETLVPDAELDEVLAELERTAHRTDLLGKDY